MKVDGKNKKSIWINENNKVYIIDQTKLPFIYSEIELKSLNDTIKAINNMQIRGAPLIGVTAAFGVYLSMIDDPRNKNIENTKKRLINTRPTAINLCWAVEMMSESLMKVSEDLRADYALKYAKKIAQDDVKINKNIGNYGFKLISEIYSKTKKQVNILTHCNAGWLATVDWGTATSPIYKAHQESIPIHIFIDETRPRNQGASLTSWELKNEGVNYTVVADNTGGHLMQRGMVDLVITGSDRTTFQGHVCNKIGTYLKALAAYENKIPFYVALPLSTIDWKTNNINEIEIEERDEDEVNYISGLGNSGNIESIRLTPFGTKCKNYAFDITPNKFITGLITEKGVCKANENEIKNLLDK